MESVTKKITPINRDTVHRICSGQVVLSLAIAVKELIENSLDAEATAVEIRLKEYGSECIEVIDNGKGIHPEDFEALALKHHTSKIRDFGDLVDVGTFGFRGEALSSLCAVSHVTVTTRHASQDCGSRLTFDSRGVLQINEPFPRQVGTTITLTNLFSSLPVRHKEFHRNLKKEFTKMVQFLSAYCLIAENVKISCINQTKKGGKTTFLATQQNKNIRENISCVFGSKQLSNLLEITDTHLDDDIVEEYGIKNVPTDRFKLRGFISSCEHGSGRSTTDRQFYYINSRPCEPTKVMKLTNETYHHYNLHQYPFVLLNIIVPKNSVDVNVTPDKRLIFLEDEKLLLACVKSTLIRLYERVPSTFKLNTPMSVLSSKNCSPSSEVKLIETNKCASFEPSQWRDRIDKMRQQTYSSTSNKRSLSQSSLNTSNSKQMKLDQIFKVAEREIEAEEENVSERLETDDELASKEEEEEKRKSVYYLNERTDRKNRENILVSKSAESSDVSLPEYTKENYDASTVTGEKEEDGITMTHVEVMREHSVSPRKLIVADATAESVTGNDETMENIAGHDETMENITGNDAIPEIGDEFEDEILASNSDDETRSVDKTSKFAPTTKVIDSSPVERIVTNDKATIDTSIEALRKVFADRRQRRKNVVSITNKFHAEIDPTKNQVAEEELKKEITKDMFREMKIVGQFNLGFIIAKLENDLFIIDQHATDEKYNFETLQRTTSLKSQKLIAPQDLNLTAMNECILVSNIEVLQKNGFEFLVDPSAETTKKVKLISIPVSQNWQFGKEDIDEMLFMLQDAPNTLCRPSRIRAMFASRACRKSVMIGMPLSVADMRRLINNMGTIEQPWNCPHGRPTMRHLINLSLLN